MSEGILSVVATPIGNMGDITHRALETLLSADLIICEDTRVTKNLLDRYNIKKPLISLNAHNESRKVEHLISEIISGKKCAIVSDAGTPCISDPGTILISEAYKNDIKVEGIPGPNAAILALSLSGLPVDSFVFDGFLPQKKGRQKKLKQLALEERTIVLYESVYRIKKLLEELNEYMPDRYILVFRELTKKFEEVWRGNANEILSEIDDKIIKGEFVVIISPLKWKTDK
jgi:16S rRNA (cytidine1402-2'-O)-methyltransferase